jgi:hypothetical protein
MELHETSLLQDADKLQKLMDASTEYDTDEYRNLEMEDIINTGEIRATRHLLSVAYDIMNSSNERYE